MIEDNKQTQMNWPKSFSSYKPRSQRVYGAICRNSINKYLLVQGRKTGRWSWPKGHIRDGEKMNDCVVREMYEETGIEDLPEAESSIRLKAGEYFIYNFNKRSPFLDPVDKNEIMNIGWFSLDEIYNNHRNCNVDVNFFVRNKHRHTNLKKIECRDT